MEKEQSSAQTLMNCPFNPVERGVPSSGNGPPEEHVLQHQEQPANVQSMYCKELVSGGDAEFSFEELRAQRYFKKLNEKVLQLNKVKQELKVQIEQKQKLIQERNGTNQHQPPSSQMPEIRSAPVLPIAAKINNEPEVSSSSAMRNNLINHDEDMGQI
ncbi:mitotic checkpoint serine/threonine-protein kinase BUB1 beta-like [Salminus brasiliensis]|uniref:mitotic checkpoint serine/threonine-protein kinase BUB1 beta-like n=1 Tax=Salminus brasiliensis TaxID=930266 RepID=UPI003B835CE5